MNSLCSGGYRINGNLNEGVGDAGIGTPNAGTTGLPTVDGAYGQLGKAFYIDGSDTPNYTNTSGTLPALYGGYYRYVQMLSTASAAVAAGQLCFWNNPLPTGTNPFSVTTDITVTNQGLVAGIILSPSWTKGNYWWVYAGGGICYVKTKASVTDGTVGNLAISSQTPAPTVDGIADAGAIATALLAKSILGTWYEATTNGAVKRILMNTLAPVM